MDMDKDKLAGIKERRFALIYSNLIGELIVQGQLSPQEARSRYEIRTGAKPINRSLTARINRWMLKAAPGDRLSCDRAMLVREKNSKRWLRNPPSGRGSHNTCT